MAAHDARGLGTEDGQNRDCGSGGAVPAGDMRFTLACGAVWAAQRLGWSQRESWTAHGWAAIHRAAVYQTGIELSI
jgi:hypothetical protein